MTVPFKYRKYQDGGFKTPTGKIELDADAVPRRRATHPMPTYEEPPESPIEPPGNCRRLSARAHDGCSDSVLLPTRSTGRSRIVRKAHRRSDGGNPSRDGSTLRHHEGRLDVDRDEARPRPANARA